MLGACSTAHEAPTSDASADAVFADGGADASPVSVPIAASNACRVLNTCGDPDDAPDDPEECQALFESQVRQQLQECPDLVSAFDNFYQCVVDSNFNCTPPSGPGPSTSTYNDPRCEALRQVVSDALRSCS